MEGLDATSLAAELGAVWSAGVSSVTKIDAAIGQELGQDSIPSPQFAEIGSIALGFGRCLYALSPVIELDLAAACKK